MTNILSAFAWSYPATYMYDVTYSIVSVFNAIRVLTCHVTNISTLPLSNPLIIGTNNIS